MSDTVVAPNSVRTFLDAIELTPIEAPASAEVVSFEATPQYVPWPKAYGGDMVAQATAAMVATVGNDRVLHSTHSTFMRPVTMFEPVRYDVEVLRDGRNFSTRHVRGVQNGKTAFLSTGSFQVPQPGPEFSGDQATEVAIDPESLDSSEAVLAGVSGPAAEYWGTGRSFDMRHVPSPLYLDGPASERTSSPHQAVWIRAFSPLPDTGTALERANLDRIALSYVCDYTILEPLLRVRGLSWSTSGLATASLDHAMWFHRPAPVDDWILYAQDAESLQSARGLALGRFFTRAGDLIATVAQEGLIVSPAAD